MSQYLDFTYTFATNHRHVETSKSLNNRRSNITSDIYSKDSFEALQTFKSD